MRVRITYQPGRSLLHRLYPLVKLGWLLFGTVFVFIVQSPWAALATLALALAGHALARSPLRRLRGVRLFASTAVLLGALQLAFVRGGPVMVQWGPLVLTARALEEAVYVAGRFLAIILLSYLFVLTTEPGALAYALIRLGVPYRYGFILITALRLVPVFEQEAQTVYNAQLARGVAYDVRSPRRLVTLARQFALPLLVSALSKVDALAISMEGRSFGRHPVRTWRQTVEFTRLDAVALALLLLAAGATLAGLI